jgi:hypothetical protein
MSDPTCKKCGGPVIVVLKRAWCVQRYDLGGCGGYWVLRNGKWKAVSL